MSDFFSDKNFWRGVVITAEVDEDGVFHTVADVRAKLKRILTTQNIPNPIIGILESKFMIR